MIDEDELQVLVTPKTHVIIGMKVLTAATFKNKISSTVYIIDVLAALDNLGAEPRCLAQVTTVASRASARKIALTAATSAESWWASQKFFYATHQNWVLTRDDLFQIL